MDAAGETRVLSRSSSYGISDGHCGTGTGLSPKYSVLSRQYHSTIAPYSYSIYLPLPLIFAPASFV